MNKELVAIEQKLLAAAAQSIQSNIQNIAGKKFLSAGGHQFRTLWTRDFCFSVKALLLLGKEDIAKDHLQMLADKTRADGLVPRVVDSLSPRLRVALSSAARVLPFIPDPLPIRSSLKAEFVDEHGTEAMDSNLLFLLAVTHANINLNPIKWLQYYAKKFDSVDGLLIQPAFSDWQDSVRREGKTLYVNLLWWKVLSQVETSQIPSGLPTAQQVQKSIHKQFFEAQSGLYRSILGNDHFSLESMLMMLDWQFLEEDKADQLYVNLKKSAFYSNPIGLPGFNTYPNYPPEWRSFAVRISGLGNYHGDIYWTWLMGLAAKIAKKRKDQQVYGALIEKLHQTLSPQSQVYEILDPAADLRPWSSPLYRSEFPFSWGSALIVEALLS